MTDRQMLQPGNVFTSASEDGFFLCVERLTSHPKLEAIAFGLLPPHLKPIQLLNDPITILPGTMDAYPAPGFEVRTGDPEWDGIVRDGWLIDDPTQGPLVVVASDIPDFHPAFNLLTGTLASVLRGNYRVYRRWQPIAPKRA